MSCSMMRTGTATIQSATCTTVTNQHKDGLKMWNKIEAALDQVESENQIVLTE